MRLTLLAAAALLAACSSSPGPSQDAIDRAVNGGVDQALRGGDASSRSGSTSVPVGPAVAAAPGADAQSRVAHGEYSSQHNNTTAGHVVQGFATANPGMVEQFRSAVDESIVLQSIAEEMAEIRASEEPNLERLDLLRRNYMSVAEFIAKLSGDLGNVDLGSLEQVTVVGMISSATGHDERAPTNEEAKRFGLMIPNIVYATSGNEAILSREDDQPSEELPE